MGVKKNIKKVLVIGSGPIIIGQAAEFDYAATQALKSLKEENLEVVLVNSNPATIMTDKLMADHIYIEPLTKEIVEKIIKIEKPDSFLTTIGGQTGLNLALELSKDNFLKENNVKLLGANLETIKKAEDRELFKKEMEKINQPIIVSDCANTKAKALDVLEKIGLPVIIRPAFTLGGTGGGIASTKEEFLKIVLKGLSLSPIHQVLIEKSVAGWKEIEFELIRDSNSNVVVVCAMENLDPVGIHTGDSIVVAPTLTISDKQYQNLRSASIEIINSLKVEGGCNCQFALNPKTSQYAVIEVNPRVSRSSALASKATGYPIAKVAAKVAIGFCLNEIENQITKKSACFEPALDYVVVKFPKWPFDKFIHAKKNLGPQMKATGEVMSIATNFEQALLKAVRGCEINQTTLSLKEFENLTTEEILKKLETVDDKRIFLIYAAIKKNIEISQINKITKIDDWFLNKLKNIAKTEEILKEQKKISQEFLNPDVYLKAKKMGFLDSTIEKLTEKKIKTKKTANFKMVDTCAAEFLAKTPYFYSDYDGEDESNFSFEGSFKKKVLVLGSGPIRIGQGIEFDYCCVHCVLALKKLGFKAIICNNNPETVSTDFDTADKLYFEAVELENVLNIIKKEQPIGVIVQFGGQTAIKLAKSLHEKNIKILGTSFNSIDIAEDREKFDKLLEEFSIPRPKGFAVYSTKEAIKKANILKYPVLLRPSYVLGGQNMTIAYCNEDVLEYMKIIEQNNSKDSVLIDKYLTGIEAEVDAICDGEDIIIPGIMQHIERAGVHSGDSISVYPCQNLSDSVVEKIVEYTKIIAVSLKVKGLLNIQFVIQNEKVYIIEANPRSSRTVPYISKVTNVSMVELATKIMFGEKIKNLNIASGLLKNSEYIAVKVPVFSFEKLNNVDISLGPEMKSTGEVLGISDNFSDALFKGLLAAGYNMHFENKKGVLITVKDIDKPEIVPLAKQFKNLGFKIYATAGTANFLEKNLISCTKVFKAHEGKNSTLELIENKKVDFIISTSTQGKLKALDSAKIRIKSTQISIPCLTSIDTAKAYSFSLKHSLKKDKIKNIKLFCLNENLNKEKNYNK